MSNSYFQFKQFKVEQGDCAMKVSTDACIQGAWTPIGEDVKWVLDIGAGTGLLSLMLAQRSATITIDAVEFDTGAAMQAKENIAASPWKDRVNLTEADIREQQFFNQYDLIICNPPFFQNSLLGSDAARNNARHTLALSYRDILDVVNAALKEEGYASVLLPATEHVQWAQLLAQNGWHISHVLNIQPNANAAVNRVVSLCSRVAREIKEETLIIYEGAHQYTPDFTALMADYYLNL